MASYSSIELVIQYYSKTRFIVPVSLSAAAPMARLAVEFSENGYFPGQLRLRSRLSSNENNPNRIQDDNIFQRRSAPLNSYASVPRGDDIGEDDELKEEERTNGISDEKGLKGTSGTSATTTAATTTASYNSNTNTVHNHHNDPNAFSRTQPDKAASSTVDDNICGNGFLSFEKTDLNALPESVADMPPKRKKSMMESRWNASSTQFLDDLSDEDEDAAANGAAEMLGSITSRQPPHHRKKSSKVTKASADTQPLSDASNDNVKVPTATTEEMSDALEEQQHEKDIFSMGFAKLGCTDLDSPTAAAAGKDKRGHHCENEEERPTVAAGDEGKVKDDHDMPPGVAAAIAAADMTDIAASNTSIENIRNDALDNNDSSSNTNRGYSISGHSSDGDDNDSGFFCGGRSTSFGDGIKGIVRSNRSISGRMNMTDNEEENDGLIHLLSASAPGSPQIVTFPVAPTNVLEIASNGSAVSEEHPQQQPSEDDEDVGLYRRITVYGTLNRLPAMLDCMSWWLLRGPAPIPLCIVSSDMTGAVVLYDVPVLRLLRTSLNLSGCDGITALLLHEEDGGGGGEAAAGNASANDSVLSHDIKLEELVISECTEVTDVSFLRYTPNLCRLDASFVNLTTSLSYLSCCLNMRELHFVFCKGEGTRELPALASLPHLQLLNMSNSNLRTLPADLHACSELLIIDFSYCRELGDATSLSHLRSLSRLNIAGTNLSSVEFLRNVRSLTTLSVASCKKLRTVAPLAGLPRLRELDGSFSNVETIGELSTCPCLHKVDFRSCPLRTDAVDELEAMGVTYVHVGRLSLSTSGEFDTSFDSMDNMSAAEET